VFQNYREAMFPWMRTIDNIAYPLKLEGRSKAEVDRRMEELVASFDVKFDLKRFPYELSGGQQQTASIMRALAPNPEVLFLDEPFSALDFEMTLFIREKLQEVFMQTGTTMLLVSHDLEEAVYLADEVLLLTKRPTKVAEILRYGDARPRTIETLSRPRASSRRRSSASTSSSARCADDIGDQPPRRACRSQRRIRALRRSARDQPARRARRAVLEQPAHAALRRSPRTTTATPTSASSAPRCRCRARRASCCAPSSPPTAATSRRRTSSSGAKAAA
jgi:ABC-type multidrug transport system ATPase subunit